MTSLELCVVAVFGALIFIVKFLNYLLYITDNAFKLLITAELFLCWLIGVMRLFGTVVVPKMYCFLQMESHGKWLTLDEVKLLKL